MKKMMIVYETKYGQTEKIARHVADLARARGHEVHLARVTEVDATELDSADAFVVLAPIFMSHHSKAVRDFIVLHAFVLRRRPGAFFSVSGSAGSKNAADREAARKIASDFLTETGWQATAVDTFAGAIAYPKYNWFLRFIMKRISMKEGGSTDTSKIDERTDWNAVDASSACFFDIVEGRMKAVA